MDKDLKFWNRVSRLYTPLQEHQNKKAYKSISTLSEEYVKGKNVLELASGTGQITKYLTSFANSYIATDYSSKMVDELAKRRFSNLKVEEADATNLIYSDNTFDVVIIANALHVMPNPDKAMEEIKRVLKPNGVLIAPTFVYDRKVNHFKLFITKLFGFKTYHKWMIEDLKDYITSFDFTTLDMALIKATPTYIGYLVLENIK